MTALIEARALTKRYGAKLALDRAEFSVAAGRIVGLIGRNGAGKTTAMKALLGLTAYEGSLSVLGLEPRHQRDLLMQQVCFIADTAVLPRWLRVDQAVEYVATIHPRFDRARAQAMLAKTTLPARAKISGLSKGMVTQLHLSLIMAIDAQLLVLDEPTLGLDLLNRREFYDTLLNDYFDKERTILVTTHQVEEVERLLTDVLFIDQGRIVLSANVDELAARYQELIVAPAQLDAARALKPYHEREVLGKHVMQFEGQTSEALQPLGELRVPSIADLFVARLQGSAP